MRSLMVVSLVVASTMLNAQQPTALQRLTASIERTTRSVNATWGI